MTTEQLEKRRRVMRRSMALGHCICDVQQPCPCDDLKLRDICHCAGERMAETAATVRLTEHVRRAGCASKISKAALQEVLRGLPEIQDPRVLVGASAGDDAAVMRIAGQTPTILTVDVFSPSVDDPYTFGQIAAANSLSDIYAMGGTPQAALSIIGFPIDSLPGSAMREILRGGIDKMQEAGVPVVGGHSINDEEIKCGFAVIGTAAEDGYVRNAGARVGDVIVLTKPLGTGIVAFAHQVNRASAAAMDAAARSMATLNRLAGELMVQCRAHAATDVTGFSLMGHMAEIVKNSRVLAELDFDALPLLDEVKELSRRDVIPGAVERNRESVDAAMLDLAATAPAQQAVLFGPETSGGMLVFLPPDRAQSFLGRLRAHGHSTAHIVGRVVADLPGGMIRVTSNQAKDWEAMPLEKAGEPKGGQAAVEPPCCCAETAAPIQDAARATPADGHGLPAPAMADAFKTYMATVSGAGAIDLRNKKLIGLALSVMSKCEPCVKINTKAARDAGASEEEIAEAVAMGIAFGGAPVAMFYNQLRAKS